MRRVLFNEITKNAILKAIEHPIDLDRKKFDSQQARRILDRLVGYQISPILWKKVRRGLSAGRVQSVAVRLVVEREREIEAFKPEEYWTLDADLAARLPPEFTAKLAKVDGKKAELKDEATTRALEADVEKARFVVETVDRKERRRNPPPPFITAKLQQEAANRLGFTAKKTMTLAQQLYEGVELGDETVGLITYMRTDSVRLSTEAVDAARVYIAERYGKDHLPETAERLQDEGEVGAGGARGRPPDRPRVAAERVAPFFEQMGERDMFRLYELIWNRFVACQMVPAVYDQTAADIAAGRATFRATGSILKFPGYLAVYGAKPPEEEAGAEEEKKDDGERDGDEKNEERQLPPLEAGEELRLVQLHPEQHFTQPPPRFNESSLVKEMEERGIGRPVDLRRDPRDHPGEGVRREGGEELQADPPRHARDRRARPRLPARDGRRLHRRDGGEARRDRGGERPLADGALRVLRDVQGGPRQGRRADAQRQGPGDRDRPRLREVRRAEARHQVGPQRRVPRLPGLPRVPEHHELPARGREDCPGEGGGRPGRREVPGRAPRRW